PPPPLFPYTTLFRSAWAGEKSAESAERYTRSLRRCVPARARRRRDARNRGRAFAGGHRSAARTADRVRAGAPERARRPVGWGESDRKSTRLNSSHLV